MKLVLTHKTHLTANAWSFQFEPEKPLVWAAGQFIKVAVPHDAPDAEGTARRFTICAAPFEKRITITTRVTSSSFKTALANVKPGEGIELIDTPAGDFLWRPSEQPLVFAAQGIGITPFYAIIKDRLHARIPVNAELIYSTPPANPVIFEDELLEWVKTDPTFKISFQEERLSVETVAGALGELASRTVYVSGPRSLVGLCLPPYDLPPKQFKQDNFPGYAAKDY